MKQEINFTIKNGAYQPSAICRQITNIIIDVFLTSAELHWDIRSGMRTDIRHELNRSSFTFDNYYIGPDGKGAKVTKVIKKILPKFFVKELIIEKFPILCKEVSELYTPKMEIKAFWGDKRLLGSGTWERDSTCFSPGGCNSVSRIFLEKFRRTKVFVLENQNEDTARCIAFFAGGRNIYLTNFYYNGLPCNKLLFVEALKRILGLEKITYKTEDFPLPIYCNDNGIKCYTEKSSEYARQYKYPCPHCDNKVTDLYSDRDKDTYLIGCSDNCCGNARRLCDRCGDYDDEYCPAPDGDIYCRDCYSDNCFYCASCHETQWNEAYISDGICDSCGICCSECHEPTPNKDILNRSTVCINCGVLCDDCCEVIPNSQINEGKCDYCYEEAEAERAALGEV